MYEIWELVENQPFFLLGKNSSFNTIYAQYLEKRKSIPCVVTRENGDILEIFESPDGGRTVYSRRFGDDYKNRKLIRDPNE